MNCFLFTRISAGLRARVVVRGLREAVGAGTPENQQISLFRQFHWPIVKEAVACFADGADDVCFCDIGVAVAAADHWRDGVDGLVERGANEIVHRGVYHDENFAAIAFDVQDAREQDACGADDGAAWFEQQATSERANVRQDGASVGVQVGRTFVGVADADAAS